MERSIEELAEGQKMTQIKCEWCEGIKKSDSISPAQVVYCLTCKSKTWHYIPEHFDRLRATPSAGIAEELRAIASEQEDAPAPNMDSN